MYKLPTEYPDLSSAEYIAVDTETYDPNLIDKGPGGVRKDGYLLGVSVATNTFRGYYPLRHEVGPNCDLHVVVRWLKSALGGRNPKIGANILYDLEWLATEGIEVKGPKYDVQIAEWLLDEEKYEYNLNSLCLKYLGKTKFETKLEEAAERMGIHKKKIKSNMPKFYAEDMEEYAIADAKDALDIFLLQKPLLTADGLDNLFYKIESPLIDVLLKMRMKGVRVDVDKAVQVRETMKKMQEREQAALNILAKTQVDVWANASIVKAAKGLGLQYPSTEKGNPSFESDWLEQQPSLVYQKIAKIRSLDRSGGTFIQSNLLDMQVNGRLYPVFRQSKNDDGGTKTGRFSAAKPNLQQVPARDKEIGPLIRSLFIAEDGCRWGKFDYKQQEPRVTVHYANASNMVGAKKALDKYLEFPDTDYHQMVADMANIPRGIAKTMNLGMAYGMGVGKMTAALGVKESEARRIYEQYHKEVPFVKALSKTAQNLSELRGYVKTIAGRRKRFDLWGPEKWTKGIVPKKLDEAKIEFGYPIVRYFTYRAMNALIQGSCADMLKIAMLDLDEAGYTPNLIVHDEVDDAEIENDKQLKEVSDIMVNCLTKYGMPLSVPLLVDVSVGKNWGRTEDFTI